MKGNGSGAHGGRRTGAGRKFVATKTVRCYACHRKIKVEKNRHWKYTMCTYCRREARQFGPGRAWIDHTIGRI